MKTLQNLKLPYSIAHAFIYKRLCFLRKNTRSIVFRGIRKLRKILYPWIRRPFTFYVPIPEAVLPSELHGIPLAKEFILDIHCISLQNLPAVYNSSIIEHGENTLLFFRYDEKIENNRHSHIGCVELDNHFRQISPFKKIDTNSSFSEDPRVLRIGTDLLLIYNDLFPDSSRRGMHIAKLDPQFSTQTIHPLDLQKKPMEKNWVPFVYDGTLHFQYALTPHRIYRHHPLQQIETSALSIWQHFSWKLKWGFPRGGTPAINIGDQYLSFFHSGFLDKGAGEWYVMGAYTFEAKPPFRITAISPHPIQFRNMYDSPILNLAKSYQRAIFPAGLICKQERGRAILYVSLGENDSATKILKIDQQGLLMSLKKI